MTMQDRAHIPFFSILPTTPLRTIGLGELAHSNPAIHEQCHDDDPCNSKERRCFDGSGCLLLVEQMPTM